MSWTDRQSIRVIEALRDKYNIKHFVETGTFKGINAELHTTKFDWVWTCEKVKKYYDIASKRQTMNMIMHHGDSSNFLSGFNRVGSAKLFYLDAHFYDPKLPKGKGKFVILKELKALKDYGKCVIVIHDFDNNLGHITYDGISLDMKLIKKDLLKIYPKFRFYTNTLASCDIMKPKETKDKVKLENLKYAWKTPRLTYRGLLYCTPTRLTSKEQRELGLREWNG